MCVCVQIDTYASYLDSTSVTYIYCTHVHTYIHTYIHTYVRTYIHIHICTHILYLHVHVRIDVGLCVYGLGLDLDECVVLPTLACMYA